MLRMVERGVSSWGTQTIKRRRNAQGCKLFFFLIKTKVSKTRAKAPLPEERRSQFFVAQKGPRVGVSIMYGMYNSKAKRYKEG